MTPEIEQARAALAARAQVTVQRVSADWQARLQRHAHMQTYPIALPYYELTEAQRSERREVAADLLPMLERWRASSYLSRYNRNFITALETKLRISSLRCPITPSEWDTIWRIRDMFERMG